MQERGVHVAFPNDDKLAQDSQALRKRKPPFLGRAYFAGPAYPGLE